MNTLNHMKPNLIVLDHFIKLCFTLFYTVSSSIVLCCVLSCMVHKSLWVNHRAAKCFLVDAAFLETREQLVHIITQTELLYHQTEALEDNRLSFKAHVDHFTETLRIKIDFFFLYKACFSFDNIKNLYNPQLSLCLILRHFVFTHRLLYFEVF